MKRYAVTNGDATLGAMMLGDMVKYVCENADVVILRAQGYGRGRLKDAVEIALNNLWHNEAIDIGGLWVQCAIYE